METKFYLRSYTSKNHQKIRIVFNYLSKRYQIDSGQKIKPSNWSKDKQKALTNFENHKKLNDLLDEQGSFIKKHVEECSLSKKRFYEDELQKEINRNFEVGKVEPAKAGEITDLISFIDFHITTKADKAKGTITTLVQAKRNIIMAYGLVPEKSIRQYEQLNLRERGESELLIPVKQIAFKDINYEWMEKFKAFLLKTTYAMKKKKMTILLRYKKNYIAKQIKLMKQFLNSACKMGYLKDVSFKLMACEWEEADTVFTDWGEIEQIKNLELKTNSVQEKVRNLYIFNCYLGLRYSDLTKRKANDFIRQPNGEVYIKLRATKTDELQKFPILPAAQKILLQYNFNLPKIDENTFNETIKIICMKAGINREETIRETRGGVKAFLVKKKYEIISSHTGRRSFATNFDADNVPLKEIMAVTSHTTEKALRTYIKKKEETEFTAFKAIGAWR